MSLARPAVPLIPSSTRERTVSTLSLATPAVPVAPSPPSRLVSVARSAGVAELRFKNPVQPLSAWPRIALHVQQLSACVLQTMRMGYDQWL